jgi:hypothetical protein
MKHLRSLSWIIFLLSLCSVADLGAQGQRHLFERLKGIRHKYNVNTLATDEYGRLWFSTMKRGAFCYDGYNYFRYKSNSDDPNSLSMVFSYSPLTERRCIWKSVDWHGKRSCTA